MSGRDVGAGTGASMKLYDVMRWRGPGQREREGEGGRYEDGIRAIEIRPWCTRKCTWRRDCFIRSSFSSSNEVNDFVWRLGCLFFLLQWLGGASTPETKSNLCHHSIGYTFIRVSCLPLRLIVLHSSHPRPPHLPSLPPLPAPRLVFRYQFVSTFILQFTIGGIYGFYWLKEWPSFSFSSLVICVIKKVF